MHYNVKSKDLSKMLSREKILKCIRWILVIGLTVSAIIFTKDNMVEYAKKRTSFKQYEEARTELPTTVLCFNPFLKTSVLNAYNLDFFDLGIVWKLNTLKYTDCITILFNLLQCTST